MKKSEITKFAKAHTDELIYTSMIAIAFIGLFTIMVSSLFFYLPALIIGIALVCLALMAFCLVIVWFA